MRNYQCQACKGVLPVDELFACVQRGNPKSVIPWICVNCHEGCTGPYCERQEAR